MATVMDLGQRLRRRLVFFTVLAVILGIASGWGVTGGRLLAHIGLCFLAGFGAAYLALFPAQIDRLQHRGLWRLLRDELFDDDLTE